MQFVISKWTSCLSSNSNMAPRYPILLSVNFCDAISFRHSSYKNKKKLFATCKHSIMLHPMQWAHIVTVMKHRIPRPTSICNSGALACLFLKSFNLPAQNVPDNPACAYTAALPHFYSGKCCLLLWRTIGSLRILSGSSLAPRPGSEPSGWSGSAPAVWSELASSTMKHTVWAQWKRLALSQRPQLQRCG